MTTAGLKRKLLSAINREEDKGLLELFYAILSEHSAGKRISKKQYNKELDEATKEIERGEIVSHQSVMKEARKWLRKK